MLPSQIKQEIHGNCCKISKFFGGLYNFKNNKGDSFQRLVDTSINKATRNKKKLLKEMDTDLTFKPKINKLSTQLDEQFKANVFNGDDLHRWDQLYLMVSFTRNKHRINIF
jgi:hypothetical protein